MLPISIGKPLPCLTQSMVERGSIEGRQELQGSCSLLPQNQSGKYGTKSDNYSIVRASQVPSHLQLKDIAFPSSLSALQYAFKPILTPPPQPQPPPQPLPQSAANSRPSSPFSRRPSPPRSATPGFSRGVIDSLKKTNDLLSQEVTKLHSQVLFSPFLMLTILLIHWHKILNPQAAP